MKIVLFIFMLMTLLFSIEVSKDNVKTEVSKAKVKTEVSKDNVKSYLDEKNNKLNEIVAKVDDVIIRQRHIEAHVAAKLQKTFFHKNISAEKRLEYNKEALEDLIKKELLFNYSQKNNIITSKDKIEEEKQKLVKQFKNEKEFIEKLKVQNFTMEELLRDIDIAERLRVIYEKKIKVELSDNDLKDYYEKNKYKFLRPEAKQIQVITVNIDPNEKDGFKIAQAKANEAYEKIQKGDSFDKIALTYSNDMYRIKGGHLGFIHTGTFPYLDKITDNLKKGDLSKVIRDDTRFFIVKVLGVNPEKQISFEKSKKQLKIDLKKRLEKENLTNILESEKKLVNVEILAK